MRPGPNCSDRSWRLFGNEYGGSNHSIPKTPPGYECELPPEVRTELNRPKRRRILGRPKPAALNPGAKLPLYLVLLGCTIVIGGSIATWRQGETAERARDKAISQSLALQPTPAPASHEPSVLPPRAPEVRRAERVPVTVERATLLRLPAQELGVYKWYGLPDVWGGYKMAVLRDSV